MVISNGDLLGPSFAAHAQVPDRSITSALADEALRPVVAGQRPPLRRFEWPLSDAQQPSWSEGRCESSSRRSSPGFVRRYPDPLLPLSFAPLTAAMPRLRSLRQRRSTVAYGHFRSFEQCAKPWPEADVRAHLARAARDAKQPSNQRSASIADSSTVITLSY
jgi:hypothetical protein